MKKILVLSLILSLSFSISQAQVRNVIKKPVTVTAKGGDVIQSYSKTPTTSVKISLEQINEDNKIFFNAAPGSFVYIKVQTDIPIMKTTMIDSIVVNELGKTSIVQVSRDIESGSYYEKPYQCTWIEYKLDEDGKKIARLILVDGKEVIVPAEKVIGQWIGGVK